MQIKPWLIGAILFFILQPNFAQEIKTIKVSDISLLTGIMIENNPVTTIEDFRKLAPNSELLPNDLTGFKTYDNYYYGGNFVSSIMMGIKFGDKESGNYKPNPILRVGLNYYIGQSLNQSTYKEERTPFDTLTSSNSGEKFPVDSVSYTNYQMGYRSQQIRFDASLIYRTNPAARWSLYGGVGLNVGMSFNAYTQIDYYQSSYIGPEENTNIAYYNTNGNYTYEEEQTKNETAVSYAGYLPLGVDFRISNTSEFFKRVHLFYEMRPTLNVSNIPELSTIVSPAFHQGIGLKVQWE